MTKFILSKATKEQVKDWDERRAGATITINEEDHPLLLESLYKYWRDYAWYNN